MIGPPPVGQPHLLHRDYETCGQLSLKTVGAHRYAADTRTKVLCCAYALDDKPVKLWIPGNPVPPEFVEVASNPDWTVVAHNDAFETAVEQYNLHPLYSWPVIPIERHRCTMAIALKHGLPARLDMAAEALELINRKDAAGQRLMHMMSKPRRARKDEDPNGTYFFDDPDRLARLGDYCQQDVATERELYERLRPLSAEEQALWELSTKINDRGFHVDRAFAEAARRIAQAAQPEIEAELAQVTGGAVTKVGQIAKLQAWLQQRGCSAKSLDRKAIEQLLATELPAPVQRALELRRGGAQAAVKKIEALLARAGEDGRVRGAFRYHGASTGRWAGEGPQPQNLKRPAVNDLNAAIAAVATGDYDHVRKLYPQPLSVVGDCTRAILCAAPGTTLIGADFSSIESRVLAWIADEEWKLDTFRRYDATRDPRDEAYLTTACRIYRVPAGTFTETSPERKVGKTCDLAFGYMGGLGAFRKFEPERFSDAEVEQFKLEWRAAHPKIKRFWYDIDRAAWTAVRERGRIVRCGRIAFKCAGAFLYLKLPSGRKLAYPHPHIKIEDLQHQVVVFKDNAAGGWRDCRGGDGVYGGVLTENAVQAISRDLLAEAMLRIEAAGYLIVLHVHDEIVAEVPEGFGSTDQFTHLMTRSPGWALELPIAAKAWTGPRYRK
jgi:DNA polymerase bacteriophage-type